jgi:hypothetical protein
MSVIPELHQFMTPDSHDFLIQDSREFLIPDFHDICTSSNRLTVRIQGPNSAIIFMSTTTNLLNIRNSTGLSPSPFFINLYLSPTAILRTCFMNFDSPTLRGWQGFTKFPNTSPSGKRVDSDDPFPRKPFNLGKKRHPQSVGVDTGPPETSQQSNRGGFLKLPPSPIYSVPWS